MRRGVWLLPRCSSVVARGPSSISPSCRGSTRRALRPPIPTPGGAHGDLPARHQHHAAHRGRARRRRHRRRGNSHVALGARRVALRVERCGPLAGRCGDGPLHARRGGRVSDAPHRHRRRRLPGFLRDGRARHHGRGVPRRALLEPARIAVGIRRTWICTCCIRRRTRGSTTGSTATT